MSSLFERLKSALPKAVFCPPASIKQIARVEKALKQRLPDWLHELYLSCNGILDGHGTAVYLYALERNDSFPESLLSWNEFLRSEWLANLPDCKTNRPDENWDDADPRPLIIIGSNQFENWAIDPNSGPQILGFDLSQEGPSTILANDLVELCKRCEQEQRDCVERLFRGRELYRRGTEIPPPKNDIDRIIDEFLRIQFPRNVFTFRRGISQRPDEKGELYILSYGIHELRMISRNGMFPFEFRLNAEPGNTLYSCVVRNLPDAIRIMLSVESAVCLTWTDDHPPVPDAEDLRRTFRASGGPDAVLSKIADVLCARDDKRRQERNRWGGLPDDDCDEWKL